MIEQFNHPNNLNDLFFNSAIHDSSSPKVNLKLRWCDIKLPTTPRTMLKHFMSELSPLEHSEILKFKEIYFISNNNSKLKVKSQEAYTSPNNNYIIIKGDHLFYRYEIKEMLTSNNCWSVIQVYDHKLQTLKTVKIMNLGQEKISVAESNILKSIAEGNDEQDHSILYSEGFFVFRKHKCISFLLLLTGGCSPSSKNFSLASPENNYKTIDKGSPCFIKDGICS